MIGNIFCGMVVAGCVILVIFCFVFDWHNDYKELWLGAFIGPLGSIIRWRLGKMNRKIVRTVEEENEEAGFIADKRAWFVKAFK